MMVARTPLSATAVAALERPVCEAAVRDAVGTTVPDWTLTAVAAGAASAAAGVEVTSEVANAIRTVEATAIGCCAASLLTLSVVVASDTGVDVGSTPLAATPLVSTRPEAAATTAAWRPIRPEFELTAMAIAAIEVVFGAAARCRARLGREVMWWSLSVCSSSPKAVIAATWGLTDLHAVLRAHRKNGGAVAALRADEGSA